MEEAVKEEEVKEEEEVMEEDSYRLPCSKHSFVLRGCSHACNHV